MGPTPPEFESHWHITDRACSDYRGLMGYPEASDFERERAELAQLSARAKLVRRQDNGLELYRVWVSSKRRVRLLVGEPGAAYPGSKPALVQVLAEHTRGPKKPGQSKD